MKSLFQNSKKVSEYDKSYLKQAGGDNCQNFKKKESDSNNQNMHAGLNKKTHNNDIHLRNADVTILFITDPIVMFILFFLWLYQITWILNEWQNDRLGKY